VGAYLETGGAAQNMSAADIFATISASMYRVLCAACCVLCAFVVVMETSQTAALEEEDAEEKCLQDPRRRCQADQNLRQPHSHSHPHQPQ